MTRIQQLAAAGQSTWFDFIERGMVQSGELRRLVDLGVSGVTSNPTIFQQAITKSAAYQDDLRDLASSGLDAKAIFEALAIADIQAAADVLNPVYYQAGGHDGFVSLEVAPDLAHNTQATVSEARRLHAAVNRPNLMVKVPATKAGIPAIRQLIADGININVTLIFSLERYDKVKEAFLQGLEQRLAAHQPIDRIASVASFFVSRVDTNIDSRLDAIIATRPDQADIAKSLLGKAAVANAKLAYRQFQAKFSGARWQALADVGAHVQRPLWASTGVKNPAYSDLLYVEPLIGPHTVNTMPPKTVEAVLGHCRVERRVDVDVDAEAGHLAALEELGISLADVTDELEVDGVKKFADSFVDLLSAIEARRSELVTG